MMKMLLFIAFFFVLHAQSFATISEAQKKNLVEAVNESRETFAVAVPIANMHEIKYDASLERDMPSCDAVREAADLDHRVVFQPREFKKRGWKLELSQEDAERFLTLHDKDAKAGRQLLHPFHTGIGCIELKEKCETSEELRERISKTTKHPSEKSAERVKRSFDPIMCFFGHDKNIQPMAGMKKGDPGSQCPNGPAESSRYLCKGTSASSNDSGKSGDSSGEKSENSSGAKSDDSSGAKTILSHSAILGFIFTIILSASV